MIAVIQFIKDRSNQAQCKRLKYVLILDACMNDWKLKLTNFSLSVSVKPSTVKE